MAVSRVGSKDRIKFAIKPVEEGWNNLTSNVVYREVLLDAPHLLEHDNYPNFTDTVAVDLDPYSPSDLDYEGPYDEVVPEVEINKEFVFKKPLPVRRQTGRKFKSASPPRNLASPEPTVPRKRPLTSASHEAWVASLPDPPLEELTEEEMERGVMMQKRSQFFKNLFDNM